MNLKPVPLLRFLTRWIYSWLFLFTVTRLLPILYIAGDCLQVYTACKFVSSEPFPTENGAWLAENLWYWFLFPFCHYHSMVDTTATWFDILCSAWFYLVTLRLMRGAWWIFFRWLFLIPRFCLFLPSNLLFWLFMEHTPPLTYHYQTKMNVLMFLCPINQSFRLGNYHDLLGLHVRYKPHYKRHVMPR